MSAVTLCEGFAKASGRLGEKHVAAAGLSARTVLLGTPWPPTAETAWRMSVQTVNTCRPEDAQSQLLSPLCSFPRFSCPCSEAFIARLDVKASARRRCAVAANFQHCSAWRCAPPGSWLQPIARANKRDTGLAFNRLVDNVGISAGWMASEPPRIGCVFVCLHQDVGRSERYRTVSKTWQGSRAFVTHSGSCVSVPSGDVGLC